MKPHRIWPAFWVLVLLGSWGGAAEQAPVGLGQLRDITGIEEVPPEPPVEYWPFWLGGSVVLAAGLTLIGWRRACRPRGEALLPPDLWALRELGRIEAMNLEEQGERFHTLVSDVVRAFLERHCQLHAPQQTTAEFLASSLRSPRLSSEQQATLREFLERCDLAKFAPVRLAPSDCEAVSALARRIVEQAT